MTPPNSSTNSKNKRAIPHKFKSCGYTKLHNPAAKSGLWRVEIERKGFSATEPAKVESKRHVIYARDDLSEAERRAAAKSRYKVSW